MRKTIATVLTATILVVGGACSSDTKPKEETLNQMCVRLFSDIYEKYDLPTDKPVSERPAECEKWMAENEVTSKAHLVVLARETEKYLSDLD